MNAEEKKYFIWILIGISFLTMVVLISLSTLSSIKEQTKSSIRESLITVLQTTQEAHHLWISYRVREVQDLAEEKELVKYTQALLGSKSSETNSATMAKLREYIKPKLERNGDKGFFIITPDRISIASMRGTNLGTRNVIQERRKEYLDNAFNGFTTFVPTFQSDIPLSSTTISLTKKVPTSFVISPIINKAGKIIAVLAIRIDPSVQFSRISQLGRLGETGETYAFDRQGLLITESRFDHHLRRSGQITSGESGILSIRITDPGGNLIEGYKPATPVESWPLTQMAKSATAGKSGSNVDGYRDYRGVKVFGAWIWDKKLEFGITTEIDVNEALQPYYDTRYTIIVTVTLIAILSFLFVFLIALILRKSKKSLHQAYNQLELRVEERTKELEDTTTDLNIANKELELLATTDGLTLLHNRRKFDEHLETFVNISIREKQKISIIMIDIDFFKEFNDNYGHQAGDMCLQKVANAFKAADLTKRPGDIIARYGGEEFIVMLYDCDVQHTYAAAKRIQDNVNALEIPHAYNQSENGGIVTVSMGIHVETSDAKTSASQIIHKADEALYKAKAKGRNCICSYAQIIGIAKQN